MRSIYASQKKQLLGLAAAFIITNSPEVALALSLEQAEQLALASDPVIMGHKATSRSFDAESTASGTLPDP